MNNLKHLLVIVVLWFKLNLYLTHIGAQTCIYVYSKNLLANFEGGVTASSGYEIEHMYNNLAYRYLDYDVILQSFLYYIL